MAATRQTHRTWEGVPVPKYIYRVKGGWNAMFQRPHAGRMYRRVPDKKHGGAIAALKAATAIQIAWGEAPLGRPSLWRRVLARLGFGL